MDGRMEYDRRTVLARGSSLLAGLGALGALGGPGVEARGAAADPPARKPGGRLRVSCAAYSLLSYLDLKNPKMTLEDFMAKCAEWGSDGTELTEYFFKKPISPDYVMRLKRQAFLLGLDITGTPIGNNFALPPGKERDAEIASVKSWVDVSADLGSPAIRIFAGSAPRNVEEPEARRWVVECIEACCDHASRRGVFLAVENHGGVVAKADGLLEIVKAVRCEWVGINLDTGNFRTEDPYADLERCAPHAITCQVKTEIAPGGKKKVSADLPRIVDILRKASYSGYVTLEYEAAEEPLEAVPRHLAELRKLVG